MVNSQNLKASVSFVGDGSTNKFYFGFDYINKQFVKVQIGNEGQSLTYPSDYTVDDRSVVLKDTPAVGVAIRVYRETSSDRIVEWADGAFIKASQMTLENLQQLHLIEEAQDYPILSSLSRYPDGINFNALNSRITGVSDPKDPQDVVTKHYMENVQSGFVAANTNILNETKAILSATQQTQSKAQTNETLSKAWATSTESPDNAEDTQSSTGKTQSSRSWALYSRGKAQEGATSATNALTSEQHAKTSETNALTSETKAKTSETNAKTSETNASASASASASSASASATSAAKAKTSETNAKTSETNSELSHQKAKKWAEATDSPDGEVDTNSPTGYTQSAKIWAALSKEYAGLSKFKLPIGYYNSVAEMKASETVIVGRPCVTLGYYQPNDGGGAIYVVRSKAASDTDDGGSILVLDNGNVAELLIDGPINVKQFGAKGDGVHDDTDSIQRAINHVTDTTFEKLYSNGKFIYTKGGGTVYIPSGIYRITETIVIGQYCRIIGDSSVGLELVSSTKENFTGTVLVADFTNNNSWILESAIYKTDGTKLGYKEKVNGSDQYNGKINFMRGIYIKNIALYTQNVVYGGIRLCMSPESILENVSISGTLIAILLNATWGSHIIHCYTKSYIYGVLSVLDVNSCSISGYFNRISDDKNIMITDDNRFDLEKTGAGLGWKESMDYKRAGIYSMYSYSLNLQNVITEGWDVGRLLINTYFSDNDSWIEGHSYAAVVARASRGRISNIHITRNNSLDYVWGDYTNIILDNSYGDELDFSDGYKMVGENTYHTGIINFHSMGGGHRYLGESDNIIYIKDKTVKGALTYATLNDALSRISTSKNQNWTIYLEAGKTYDFSISVNITNKNITFVKTGEGDNPRIKHHVNSDRYLIGYQVRNGSTFSLNLSYIDIEIAEDDTPINTSDTGLITLATAAINGSLMISNANINMKSWCFLQLMTGASCVLTSSFNNCTYKGTAKRGGYVYEGRAKLIVIDGDYNNTFDDAVIAGTTKGWNDSIATIL